MSTINAPSSNTPKRAEMQLKILPGLARNAVTAIQSFRTFDKGRGWRGIAWPDLADSKFGRMEISGGTGWLPRVFPWRSEAVVETDTEIAPPEMLLSRRPALLVPAADDQ